MVQSTLFVPDNSGLPDNQVSPTPASQVSPFNVWSLCVLYLCLPQTLSQQDIELHLLDGQALPVGQLKNGSRIKTRVGTLSVFGITDLLNPSALVSSLFFLLLNTRGRRCPSSEMSRWWLESLTLVLKRINQ